MAELIADSTGFWTWEAPEAVDALTLVATDPTGAVVDLGNPVNALPDGTASSDQIHWRLDVQSADVPAAKIGRWIFNPRYEIDSQVRSDPQAVWLLPNKYLGYGSMEGVATFFTAHVFTSVSRPSISNALEVAATQRRLIDLRLKKAGYSTPLSDEDAVAIIGDAENLLAASALFERMVIGREPTSERVAVAQTWRRQAEELLAPILSGSAALYGSPKTGVTAGMANSTDLYPDVDLAEFATAFGEQSIP